MLDTETKTLLADVKNSLGEANKIKGAVEQLEEQMRGLPQQFKQQLDAIRKTAWDANGRYRGMFDTEEHARGFGLLAMGHCGNNTKALEALKRDFPEAHERAMASDPDASGGALVAPEFSTRMQELFEQHGVFERNAFKMPMNSSQLNFIKVTGDVQVYLLSENTAGTDDKPDLANIELNAKEWGALVYVPKSLNEDAAASVGELVARSIVRAMAKKMDQIGFIGDGTSTYFGIRGVVQRLKDVSDDITSPTAGGGLIIADGNAWSEITAANFEKVVSTVPDYTDDLRWYCSRAFYWQVIVPIILAGGGVTAEELEGKRRMLFLGYPVEITNVMPKVEGNSQVCCLFGDLNQAATVGDRKKLSIDTSAEAEFAKRQLTILGVRRVAVNVHDVGDNDEAGPIVGLITAAS